MATEETHSASHTSGASGQRNSSSLDEQNANISDELGANLNDYPRSYRGRFAPSPSGPLHAGSLVAALGSFLDARAHRGKWLVRIEDIDPPREIPGAADTILQQLEAHGLLWDETVSWQSQNSERYEYWLARLSAESLSYCCTCTRAEIKARGEQYDGHCRFLKRGAEGAAVRLINENPIRYLHDRWHGRVELAPAQAAEDFVLRRRDGFWAYQLAVVSDDYASGITDIVRGEDLLHASGWQLTLWQQFNQLQHANTSLDSATNIAKPLPRLGHLPLVFGEDGRKLSKQNHAQALGNKEAKANLAAATQALGLTLPDISNFESISAYLAAATESWRENRLNSAN
ncbi:tRNA glutamyl-Q(34) synthetase GluQRS [Aliidiomarina iranensis]|uniref:Glutamyl-Q tRNA(Asp) synthetase n=1 Tax=Aliidiomarina iranensis TaxID=1434071 RepID=A0A432VV71_9GAMM|nr:tRNA glutamyl-Q(34) synthetase GluQRS [Aliidiomarina iranensis]RUO20372.1 tRNA glutamyl-Q(34) synthetase GluQRS [Aliidiomarina iranensis]